MKKFIITLSLILVAFSGFSAIASQEQREIIIEIDSTKLQELWAEKKDLVVIDSRGGKYFDGVMIKGAVHLPVNEVTAETLEKNIATKATPVAFYCVNPQCPASGMSAYKAKDQGYTEIYVYEGGIEDWIKQGLPTVKGD